MRALALALLWSPALSADTAVVRVGASIASFATVEVVENYARMESNDPDAAVWANGVPLTDAWVCVLDCEPDARWVSR